MTQSLPSSAYEDQPVPGAYLILEAIPSADRAVIMLRSSGSGVLDVAASRSRNGTEGDSEFQISRTLLNWVLTEKLALMTQNVPDDSRLKSSESIRSNLLRAVICVPVFAVGKVIGVLYVDSGELPEQLTQEDVAFTAAVANELALTIVNAQLQQSVIRNERMAAIGLVLFEHFQNKSTAKDLKEAVISSFWCGLMAKAIAKKQNMADQEEAFICAMMHQLGKLMAIYHLPREYRAINQKIAEEGETEDKAVKNVLGTSYKVLGAAVARLWNFPERISESMKHLSDEQLSSRIITVDPLCALAGFANDLCRIASQVSWESRDHGFKKLLGRYSKYITISERQLNTIINSSLEKVYSHADALQFSVTDSEFLRSMSGDPKSMDESLSHKDDQKIIEPQSKSGAAFHFTGDGDSPPLASDPQDSISIIMDGIQEISATLMEPHEINDVALMSLEIMYRALKCHRVILFINESSNRTMQARFGYGQDSQRIADRVDFKIKASKDLFNHAIQTNKDLIVDDVEAPELRVLIPDWYRKAIEAKAFIFLPVVFSQICIGAFYADRQQTGPPINEQEYKYLAMLRNQLILAIKLSK